MALRDSRPYERNRALRARDDVPAIVRLLADDALGAQRELVKHPVAPVYLRAFDDMAEQPGNDLLVAVLNGEVIGCLQLTIISGLSRQGVRQPTSA